MGIVIFSRIEDIRRSAEIRSHIAVRSTTELVDEGGERMDEDEEGGLKCCHFFYNDYEHEERDEG